MAGTAGERGPQLLGPRGRRVLAVVLAIFLVLNVLTGAWGYAVAAGVWLALLVAKELVDRRQG